MSAGVAVEALRLAIGGFRLGPLDFAIASGEILVVMGPNGAGKSVALETIAGFHRPDGGRVRIGERDVTRLPPERRNVGFVVQNFGLFPHLTVAQNIAIARRGPSAAPDGALAIQNDPAALLSYFQIAHLAARQPQGLSPGEKQRAALARALAGAPRLFLFDEPFSALDAQTRDQLRDELRSFLRALAIPAIFVTHDHTDALTLADRIVVLRDGAMVQTGAAADIYRRPANSFVARFVGTENVLLGRVTGGPGGFANVAVGDLVLRAAPGAGRDLFGTVIVAIRAEDVVLRPSDRASPDEAGMNRFHGLVTLVRGPGPLLTIEIDCGAALKAYLLPAQVRAMNVVEGGRIAVEIAADAIHLMPD